MTGEESAWVRALAGRLRDAQKAEADARRAVSDARKGASPPKAAPVAKSDDEG